LFLVLTKSVKDLQRQTSTLTNVELLFNNEIKSSLKRIDDAFKQLRDIIKEREVELYLEMDKVKEQGLSVIHRRQQRAVELRQRIDRCDRLEPNEIDHLRNDIKQFVTDRRYELGEQLTSSHRFEYDQTLTEALKHFGNVLKIERRCSVAPASPSALVEPRRSTDHAKFDVIPEKVAVNNVTNRNSIGDNSPSSSQTNGHQSMKLLCFYCEEF
jgi:16S rRNA C1402 (ribose-2'-O) methylase RsmI